MSLLCVFACVMLLEPIARWIYRPSDKGYCG